MKMSARRTGNFQVLIATALVVAIAAGFSCGAGESNPWQAAAESAAAAESPAALILSAAVRESADAVPRYLAAAAWLERLKSEHASDRGEGPVHACSLEELQAAACLCADADWRIRAEAARICGLLAAPAVAYYLAPLLFDEAWPVRRRAIEALAVLEPGKNIPLLATMLERRTEEWYFERRDVVRALGALAHTPSLVRALSDPAAEVRKEAAWQIERLPVWPAEVRAALDAARRAETDAAAREALDKVWAAQRPEPGPGEELMPHREKGKKAQ